MTLLEYITEQGMTQEQFADRIGVTQSAVSKFILGQARPKVQTARNIEFVTLGAVPMHIWTEEPGNETTDKSAV